MAAVEGAAGGAGGDYAYPDYVKEQDTLTNFLSNYRDETPDRALKYLDMIQEVADRRRVDFPIELDDVAAFEADESLAEAIATNAKRYLDLFARSIDGLLPAPSVRTCRRSSVPPHD